jgi:HD-GYP domain-containing protein (c-di-GMP phosphodiesterase class II)
MNTFSHLFDSSGFMPHGHCFLWTPSLLWSLVASDTIIAVSYYSIPIALWYFASKRRDLPYRWVFILFGFFVMACGSTHLFDVWIIWHPDYWGEAAVQIFTAVISAATAVALWYLMPKALAIPSRQQLNQLNHELKEENNLREQAEIELKSINLNLETHVEHRAAELRLRNTILATQLETSLDAILLVGENGKILAYNKKFMALWHIPEELMPASVDEQLLKTASQHLADPEEFIAEVRYLYEHRSEKSRDELHFKDGRIIDRYSAPVIGENNYFGRVWYFRDVTKLKRAEQAEQKVTRALMAISQCNTVLIHATDEAQLLQDMCRVIVDQAAYQMAWVGYVEHDAGKTVRPVAHAGYPEGYMEQASVTWSDTTAGSGPAGKAIRTKLPDIISDAQTAPEYEPWREHAVNLGYSSVAAFPLITFGNVLGVLCIYSATLREFEAEEISLLTELADDLAFGIGTLRTRELHGLSAAQLLKSMEGTVLAMGSIVEMRDPYTAGHQNRVSELSSSIAQEMGLSESDVHGIHLAASIHDLGKIKVPAEILSKPSRLTDIEYSLIKDHPQAGYDILKTIDFPWPIAEIVYQHHERNDGSGYPRGLKAPEILIGAKILAVADTVEAMTSHRPYRPGLGVEAALGEITRGRGTYYEAQVVDCCLRLFKEGRFKLNV